MNHRALLVSILIAGGSAFAMAQDADTPNKADLDELYQRYEDAGRNSAALPELGQRIVVSGVVLSQSRSLAGNGILKAGTSARPEEMARLTAYDDEEEQKMQALAPKAPFRAVCKLDFTSGMKYLALQECVFQ